MNARYEMTLKALFAIHQSFAALMIINNNNKILIKREPLVLPELGALYREKKVRTVQQQ